MAAYLLFCGALLTFGQGLASGAALSATASAPRDGLTEATLLSSGSMIAHGTVEGQQALLRRESNHDSPVRAHGQELLEKHGMSNPHFSQATDARPIEAMVNCGNHEATRCRLCTVEFDPVSHEEISGDKGAGACNGDCKYFDGECHKITGATAGRATAEAEAGDLSTAGPSTVKTVDLTNPKITPEDKDLMDKAAESSVEEAEYEAQMRLAAEKKKEEENNNTTNKFIYYAVCSFAFFMMIAACGSCFALYKFMGASNQKPLLAATTEG